MKYRLERVREVLKRELGVIMVRELRFTSPLVTVSDVDIKYTPHLHFKLDGSIERGARVITIMDELGLEPEAPDSDESQA